ncbi:MAG: hypothetical protein LBJ08_05995 [Bifidobacteriaceae bacterium]|jgi:signal transduction histidine kinase|nr:hypothetical protein [Bifidobacteriaceae bacterium]
MIDPESDDRGTMIGAGLVTLAFFSLVAFTQWVTYNLWSGPAASGPSSGVLGALAGIAMAFIPSATVIVVFALTWGHRWQMVPRAVALVLLPILASAGRLGLLGLIWPNGLIGPRPVAELFNGIVPAFLALVIGLYYVDAQDRARRIQRLIAIREVEAQRALSDLEHEELRVRRSVSEKLHGRIQQRLVFVAARLTPMVAKAKQAGLDREADELLELIDDLDQLREEEVRQLSHALYPTGLDMGLQQALRLEIGRIPPNLAVDYSVTPEAAGVDDVANPELDSADRLLLVSALEEGLTNAVKHGAATGLRIEVGLNQDDDAEMVVITVADNGRGTPCPPTPPMPAGAQVSSGLARLARRFEGRGGGLKFEPGDGTGATLRVWLPRPRRGTSEPSPAAEEPAISAADGHSA